MAQLVVDHFLERCSTGFRWSVNNLFRIKLMLHHFKSLFLYTLQGFRNYSPMRNRILNSALSA